jgi:hypothetical protein
MVLAMVAVAAVACAKRSEAPSAKASEAAPTPVMLESSVADREEGGQGDDRGEAKPEAKRDAAPRRNALRDGFGKRAGPGSVPTAAPPAKFGAESGRKGAGLKLFAEAAQDADKQAGDNRLEAQKTERELPDSPAAAVALAAPLGAAATAQARGLVDGKDLSLDKKQKAESVALAKPSDAVVKEKSNAVTGESDASQIDAAGDQEDACGPQPQTQQPMPRRCHLASNYRAGQGIWQRRLEALTALPQPLRDQAGATGPAAELLPPETKALAVAARLDREHQEGPGQVWMRVSLRSTDRWGMRRPPFDLAVVVGPAAAQVNQLACRTLEALVQRMEPQDRLTLIRGSQEAENLDGLPGAEALSRVRAVCASGSAWATAPLADQHRRARQLLARHAQAQHRVAGSRLVVAIATAADLADPQVLESAAQGVLEPTLSSALVLDAAALDPGWQLADAGHGLLEYVAQDPNAAAQRLWYGWGRVVARLVRVDLRLAPGVVALRVVGSRVLDQQETQRVRRQETAVDQNLARVAGVKRDRQQDGEGMTMLIAAFLGSDEHVIDVLLQVQGPGPVADVVVDYKDLVRMANEKAMSRASLARVSMRGTNPLQAIARPELDRLDWPQLAAVRQAIAQRDEAALDQLVQALQQRADQQPLAEFAAALRAALRQASAVEPLLAALDVYIARGRGCHVAARAD